MAFRRKRSRLADARFFRALENAASVLLACQRAGYSRAAVYRWRAKDAGFARRWEIANDMAADLFAEEADRRGRDGVAINEVLPRNSRGPRRYSDTLLLARLKVLKPALYRDPPPEGAPARRRGGPRPRVYDSGGVTVIDYAQPTASEWARSEESGAPKWRT